MRKKQENKRNKRARSAGWLLGLTAYLALVALLLLLGKWGMKAKMTQPAIRPGNEAQSESTGAAPKPLRHVPFLFPDGDHWLRPDEAMDDEALAAALEALLPEGSEEENARLRQQLTAVGERAVSRRDFARQIAEINAFTAEERLLLETEARPPVDLDPADPDYALLLEASMPHTAGESGDVWSESLPVIDCAPEMQLRGTTLYCVGENGRLLRNAAQGPLQFGADGRYSSGDKELDAYVTACLAALQEQFPGDAADRLAMLRHCYDYVRDSFIYLGCGHKEESEIEVIEAAKSMFRSGEGQCYHYASVFRALARGLGYPAHVIRRSLDSSDRVHAWTDIVIRGIPYVFDPQQEQYFGENFWMQRYDDVKQYGYIQPDPAEYLGFVPYTQMKYHQPPEQQGEVIEAQGEGGEIYLIYLPYGYDPDKQYRVLIYLNGADGDPYKMLGSDIRYRHGNFWFNSAVNTKYFIDYLIQVGDCDPLIVVSTNEEIVDWIGERYLRLIQYTVDNYSTYAASSAVEDLVAARDYFAIAGPSNAAESICLSIQRMPDIFAYYGIFSGMKEEEETLAAFEKKGPIRFLMMNAGALDYNRHIMEKSYEVWSQLDNVRESCLQIVPRAEHDWVAFDAAIRHLLFYFSPKTE